MAELAGERQGRGPLVVFIFSLVVVQGLTINLMQVLFGTMEVAFGASQSEQGALKSWFLAGGIVALFVSGYVTEYARAKRSGILAIVLIGIGSLLLGLADTYRQVLMAAFVMGLGTFWILSAYSAVITGHFADVRQRMFMWVTAAFAASATVSTTLFGRLLDAVPNWQLIFLGLAALIWAWFATILLVAWHRLEILGRPTKSEDTYGVDQPKGPADWFREIGKFLAAGLLNRGTFWILAFLVVLDLLAAGAIVDWTAQLFRQEHGFSNARVGLMISASSAGVFVGRLVMGAFVSGRFTDRSVLGFCYAAGVLVYVFILIFPIYWLGLVLMFLNGAFIAAQAPTMYAIASAKFGERAATAIPLVDAIGVLVGSMGPAAVGTLADRYGLHTVLWLIPAVGCVFVATVLTWQLVDRRLGGEAARDV
jgi:MFS family permease